MPSPLGGEGFATQRSLTPASLSAIGRAFEALLQNQQSGLNRQHQTIENEKNRKAQKKAQEHADHQFWGKFAADAALDFVPSLVGGGVVGYAENPTSSVPGAVDTASRDILPDASTVTPSGVDAGLTAGDFGGAGNIQANAPASLVSGDDFPANGNGTPMGLPKGTFDTHLPKYALGNTRAGSVARGMLGGFASARNPALGAAIFNQPFKAADAVNDTLRTGLAYGRLGEQIGVDASTIKKNEAAARASDARARHLESGGGMFSNDQAFGLMDQTDAALGALPPEAADQRHAIMERTLKDYGHKMTAPQREFIKSQWRQKWRYQERLPGARPSSGFEQSLMGQGGLPSAAR